MAVDVKSDPAREGTRMNGGEAVLLKQYCRLKDVKKRCVDSKRRASSGLCGFKQALEPGDTLVQQDFSYSPAKVQGGRKQLGYAPCSTYNTTPLKCHTLCLIAVLLRQHHLVCSTQQTQACTVQCTHPTTVLYTH